MTIDPNRACEQADGTAAHTGGPLPDGRGSKEPGPLPDCRGSDKTAAIDAEID